MALPASEFPMLDQVLPKYVTYDSNAGKMQLQSFWFSKFSRRRSNESAPRAGCELIPMFYSTNCTHVSWIISRVVSSCPYQTFIVSCVLGCYPWVWFFKIIGNKKCETLSQDCLSFTTQILGNRLSADFLEILKFSWDQILPSRKEAFILLNHMNCTWNIHIPDCTQF